MVKILKIVTPPFKEIRGVDRLKSHISQALWLLDWIVTVDWFSESFLILKSVLPQSPLLWPFFLPTKHTATLATSCCQDISTLLAAAQNNNWCKQQWCWPTILDCISPLTLISSGQCCILTNWWRLVIDYRQLLWHIEHLLKYSKGLIKFLVVNYYKEILIVLFVLAISYNTLH